MAKYLLKSSQLEHLDTIMIMAQETIANEEILAWLSIGRFYLKNNPLTLSQLFKIAEEMFVNVDIITTNRIKGSLLNQFLEQKVRITNNY